MRGLGNCVSGCCAGWCDVDWSDLAGRVVAGLMDCILCCKELLVSCVI